MKADSDSNDKIPPAEVANPGAAPLNEPATNTSTKTKGDASKSSTEASANASAFLTPRRSFDERAKKKASGERIGPSLPAATEPDDGREKEKEKSRSSFEDRLKSKLSDSESNAASSFAHTPATAAAAVSGGSNSSTSRFDDHMGGKLSSNEAGTPSSSHITATVSHVSKEAIKSFEDRLNDKLSVSGATDSTFQAASLTVFGESKRNQSSFEDRLKSKLADSKSNATSSFARTPATAVAAVSSESNSSTSRFDDRPKRKLPSNETGTPSSSHSTATVSRVSKEAINSFEDRLKDKLSINGASNSTFQAASLTDPGESKRNRSNFEKRLMDKMSTSVSSQSSQKRGEPQKISCGVSFEDRVNQKFADDAAAKSQRQQISGNRSISDNSNTERDSAQARLRRFESHCSESMNCRGEVLSGGKKGGLVNDASPPARPASSFSNFIERKMASASDTHPRCVIRIDDGSETVDPEHDRLDAVSEEDVEEGKTTPHEPIVGLPPAAEVGNEMAAEHGGVPMLEAYLVEDASVDEGRQDRVSFIAVTAEPLLPWWNQKRFKAFAAVMVINVIAMGAILGTTLSSKDATKDDAPVSTTEYVIVEATLAPSTSVVPSPGPTDSPIMATQNPSLSLVPSVGPTDNPTSVPSYSPTDGKLIYYDAANPFQGICSKGGQHYDHTEIQSIQLPLIGRSNSAEGCANLCHSLDNLDYQVGFDYGASGACRCNYDDGKTPAQRDLPPGVSDDVYWNNVHTPSGVVDGGDPSMSWSETFLCYPHLGYIGSSTPGH